MSSCCRTSTSWMEWLTTPKPSVMPYVNVTTTTHARARCLDASALCVYVTQPHQYEAKICKYGGIELFLGGVGAGTVISCG